MSVVVDDAERGHDDDEEFFADYRKAPDSALYVRKFRGSKNESDIPLLRVQSSPRTSFSEIRVSVKVMARRESQILATMDVFEAKRRESLLPLEIPTRKSRSCSSAMEIRMHGKNSRIIFKTSMV